MNMPARICAPKPRPSEAELPIRLVNIGDVGLAPDRMIGVDGTQADIDAALPQDSVLPPTARSGTRPAPSERYQPNAFTLLDREERLTILLSRGSARRAAFAGRWTAALSRLFPARDQEGVAARTLQIRQAALRRFSILYRLDRGGLDFSEDERLSRAGYSEAQAAVIRALVERFDEGWSPPPRRWTNILFVFALAAGGAFLLYRWLAAAIDDRYIAALLSIVIATGTISFFAVTARPNGGT